MHSTSLVVASFATFVAVAMACTVEGTTTLREAGEAAGLYMGSQFKFEEVQVPGVYRSTHSTQYGLSTVGNACKWAATHPSRGEFTLDKCNASKEYALGQGQAVSFL